MRHALLTLIAMWALGGSASVIAADVPAPQPVAEKTRCPVCGMYPARYPKWKAQILFSDASASSFDSPLELFIFLGDMARFDKLHGRNDIAAIYVSDYDTRSWVVASKAWFVAGSRVTGPMNEANLPAFAQRKAAEVFAAAQGGRVLGFEAITPKLLADMAGNRDERPPH